MAAHQFPLHADLFSMIMYTNPGKSAIPKELTLEQFNKFVLPQLSQGKRGPRPKLTLHKLCNYFLLQLYMGCQWKMLPIDLDSEGSPEIHYTRLHKIFQRWSLTGCIDRIFEASVKLLHDKGMLDLSIIHGDGTSTTAKKGGDNIGYNGHKHMKGDKVVAFCERNCNIIAPFVSAPGNRNESPLLRDALPKLKTMANNIGFS